MRAKILKSAACATILAFAWSHAAFAQSSAGNNLYRPKQGLFLIEPIDPAMQTLPNSNGIDILYLYFNLVWPWIIGCAAGFAVLQAMVGGFMMMMSGGDSGLREQGQSKLLWAIAGMLLVAFSGFILRVLNPTFFR
jgi:hypothetical protein